MFATPREEEPQISVPMIDVFVQAPELSPREVENLAVRGLERRMWEIPGVDHVYSRRPGTVRPEVTGAVRCRREPGELHREGAGEARLSSMDELPAGVSPPLVKAHSIDDVPILRRSRFIRIATAPTSCARSRCISRTRSVRCLTWRRRG